MIQNTAEWGREQLFKWEQPNQTDENHAGAYTAQK